MKQFLGTPDHFLVLKKGEELIQTSSDYATKHDVQLTRVFDDETGLKLLDKLQ